jgi:O-antigen/teichoic acid export membrane protein
MISNIVCARLLGSTQFGELAIVLTTTNLFTTLFASGLSMTATKYVAEYRSSNPNRAGAIAGLSWVTSIIVGAMTALLMVLLGPWLSRSVLNASHELSTALSLGAAAMFFAALNGSQVGTLSGLEAFNRVAAGNLVRGIATIILVSGGAAIYGLTGALLGYVAAGAATAVFYQIAVRRECIQKVIVISYRFSREDFRVLWRFTLPVLVTTFSFTPAAWWSNVLLANKSGYSEAGVFAAILNWQAVILFFSGAVSGIGLPMLSNISAERDAAKYKRCLAINFVLTTAPAIAIAVPVAVCSRFIVSLYGPSFEHGSTAMALISIAAVLSAINIPVGHAIWSLDATVSAVLFALLRGGVLVLASYVFAQQGATGIAVAYVIMGVVQTLASIPLMIWLLRRTLFRIISPDAALA